MQIHSVLGAAAALLVFGAAASVQAATINFGVDVRANGTVAQVGFYDGQPAKGGDNGSTLSVFNQYLGFDIETPGLAGATVNGFELFIDATDVDCNGDGCDGDSTQFSLFRGIVAGDDKIRFSVGADAAYVADTAANKTLVPTEFGPLGLRLPTPYPGDVDNAFFMTWAPGASFDAVASQILAGQVGLEFTWGNAAFLDILRSARVDGVNLKVDYTPAPVPEPGTLLLLGSAVAAVATHRRRRR